MCGTKSVAPVGASMTMAPNVGGASGGGQPGQLQDSPAQGMPAQVGGAAGADCPMQHHKGGAGDAVQSGLSVQLGNVPPGIARRLANGKGLPPGLARKLAGGGGLPAGWSQGNAGWKVGGGSGDVGQSDSKPGKPGKARD